MPPHMIAAVSTASIAWERLGAPGSARREVTFGHADRGLQCRHMLSRPSALFSSLVEISFELAQYVVLFVLRV
eukprot:7218481-Pyramimonas_sp.AAC.1